MNTFTITCYGTTETYNEDERQKQMDRYEEAIMMCDGCERDRYVNIYFDLKNGKKHCGDE